MIKKGLAGRVADVFISSKLTPIIVIVSIVLGVAAIGLTPKEEEPQIPVPMMDISITAPGLNADEVERDVTEFVERSLWGIDGVEYIYSATQAHGALITVRFKVGQQTELSLVKVKQKLESVSELLPPTVTIAPIRSLSIDDVPFLAITFSSANRDGYGLRESVAPVARILSSTPEVSKTELLGGLKRVVRVEVSPEKLQAHGLNVTDVARALENGHAYVPLGKNWRSDRAMEVELGAEIKTTQDVARIPVAQRLGQVVHVGDVATLTDGPEVATKESLLFDKSQQGNGREAVTLVFSKRKGANVSELSHQLLTQLSDEKSKLSPDISVSVIRDYGESASEKTHTLIEHLLIATLSVSALIAIFMGIRAAAVVIVAIPVTLALTLSTYYFLGYTLNRVTFFALIFSIGILVDDAIVVVENVERHLKADPKKGLIKSTIEAVSEVGNPTILATFTVIAAILPMAFVRGLMGPYMKPIPVGASLAMILSLMVAFTVTPWASVRLLKPHQKANHNSVKISRLDEAYRRIMNFLLSSKRAGIGFLALIGILLLLALALFAFKAVKVKMLPFDNKTEFQVMLDYPVETPYQSALTQTEKLAQGLLSHPQVEKVQLFSGEAAPFSFSGMVKHTFLRHSENQVDIHVVLTPKDNRRESSHQIIQQLRPRIQRFAAEHQAVSKILEIPPGPPVMATMVAEIYGPNRFSQDQAVKTVRSAFEKVPSVVDLDDTSRPVKTRQIYRYNAQVGGELGTSAQQLAQMGRYIFNESPVMNLNNVETPEPVNVVLSVNSSRSDSRPFAGHRLNSLESGSVNADQVVSEPQLQHEPILYRKNLRPVSYVTSELSGSEEAPVYAILSLLKHIPYQIRTVDIPWPVVEPVVKWDGEWFITYEVFRDLGLAFLVVMALIYVLILGWFKRFAIPLVIMAPIPISLIGIIPGHWVTGAYFTATSMIGFIAGAGIIVRNSIILVDFIEHQVAEGLALKDAVISAGIKRFRPMLLTAGAVVVGSCVMFADPIFQGLAVSLMFGEIAATLLSRFTVPLLYYWVASYQMRTNQLKEN